MKIFKFRVIIDTEEDVFRDIEIETDDTFHSLHKAILSAFDFDEGEMASFYMSDDQWERGEEITLTEMGEGAAPGGIKTMSGLSMEALIKSPEEKLIYVYDFLRMWCFYLELVEVKKGAPSTIYPRVALVFGEAPTQDSKEVDLFADMGAPGESESKAKGKEKISTGDPELDAYLNDDDEDDDDDDMFTSLDDLDDDRY